MNQPPPRHPDELELHARLDMSRGTLYASVFLFCFALTLGAANLLFTARQVNSVRAVDVKAARNTASVIQLCQAINDNRQRQVILWDHIIAISAAPPHETARQEQRRLVILREFAAFVDRTFAPANCHHYAFH